MLTGKRPFDRGTPIATAMCHVNEPPPPLGDEVPEDLRDVVASLLEKDPTDRPENALAVAVLLGVAPAELADVDVDLASGVPSGGYVVLPVTPLTPSTPLEAVKPADRAPARPPHHGRRARGAPRLRTPGSSCAAPTGGGPATFHAVGCGSRTAHGSVVRRHATGRWPSHIPRRPDVAHAPPSR